jgi:hypothetical protein
MYQPIRDFPEMKRSAVMIAPTATSRHSRSQSGSTLKTAAKRKEISASETKVHDRKHNLPNGSAALI